MAFLDLTSELVGVLPGLSPILADTFINRGWRKVRDARRWNFLVNDSQINCPALISSGSFTITQFSQSVTADATASAALTPYVNAVSAQPDLTALQIRFMGLGQTSQVYNILGVDATTPTALVLALDRPVQESTNAASQYMVYRVYIVPPISDFLRWESLDDMVNGIRITGPRLTFTSTYFDQRDPQRQALGLSYYCGFYRGDQTIPLATSAPFATPSPSGEDGSPIYELWPGSTQGQNFYARFRRQGQDFSEATDTQPSIVPDALIVQAALVFHAYPWAQANQGHFPGLKGINWVTFLADQRLVYFNMLQDAKRQDDEQGLQSVFNRGHGLKGWRWGRGAPPIIDANWMQSHPVTW